MPDEETILLKERNALLEKKLAAFNRELEIEAALERVRSGSTAMHNSNDLHEVIKIVTEQLLAAGIKFDNASFVKVDAEGNWALWISTPVQSYPSLVHVPYFNNAMLNKLNEAIAAGKEFYAHIYNLEEKNDFFNHFFNNTIAKSIPDERKQFVMNSKGYAHSVFLTGDIWLGISNYEGKPYSDEENAIIKRFATAFQQAYIRFLDFQKAEANAKEAVKQAALDRIRAEIASMRTKNDLEKINPLIWNELTILGIPFIRCGIFIMNDAQQLVQTFLSTPDGKAIAVFHIPYNSPGNIKDIINHWHNNVNYINHWDETDFTEFANTLVEIGALASSEQYLQAIPHGGFYLHFIPFLQGMLYVGNTTQLSENEINLIQAMADAFSGAYARYEDFNKLDAAKQQVEKTLADLKQTQQQLVHAEKMASLGELTAGIAHEIQNPLNFVNNFSEVNKELIEEIKSQKSKLKSEELDELLNDIAANEEKIIHHGKRADAIVKGMLQHSRKETGTKEPTDINALCDEYLRLSYHGLRAKDKSFNADFKTDFDESIGKINIIPQDIGRVLLNLFNNAFYATNEKLTTNRFPLSYNYKPLVSVQTKKLNFPSKGFGVEIRVSDNGNGIPKNIIDKIFNPFFTTKPAGQGTGLGLSLAYDIITKEYNGIIKAESIVNEGSTFIINLPA